MMTTIDLNSRKPDFIMPPDFLIEEKSWGSGSCTWNSRKIATFKGNLYALHSQYLTIVCLNSLQPLTCDHIRSLCSSIQLPGRNEDCASSKACAIFFDITKWITPEKLKKLKLTCYQTEESGGKTFAICSYMKPKFPFSWEILLIISKFLDVQSVARCASVSTHFLQYRYAPYRFSGLETQVANRLLQHQGPLSSFDDIETYLSKLRANVRDFSKIRSLDIKKTLQRDLEIYCTPFILEDLSVHFPMLEHLSLELDLARTTNQEMLRDRDFEHLSKLKNLKSLSIQGLQFVEDDDEKVIHFFSNTQLESIQLLDYRDQYFSDRFLHHYIFRYSKNLKKLTFSHIFKKNPLTVEVTFKDLPLTVEVLELFHCSFVPGALVPLKDKNVKTLRLCFSQFDPSELADFPITLDTLDLTGCENAKELIPAIGQHLFHSLNLSQTSINYADLCLLPATLQRLDLVHCNKLKDRKTILENIAHLPNLTELYLEEGVNCLKAESPSDSLPSDFESLTFIDSISSYSIITDYYDSHN
jgi:hypothetical protein